MAVRCRCRMVTAILWIAGGMWLVRVAAPAVPRNGGGVGAGFGVAERGQVAAGSAHPQEDSYGPGPAARRHTAALDRTSERIPAGVARWHLTHQHLDLKEQFQARVANTGQSPAAFTRRLSEFENLKAVHAKLVAHCTELEERLLVYATVINVLSLERSREHQAPSGRYPRTPSP